MNKREEEFIKTLRKYINYDPDYWDKNEYNWKEYSWLLASYCANYINIWWDPDKYDYDKYSWDLSFYCSDEFNIWYDKNKFNWDSIIGLVLYCNKYFNLWIDDALNYISKLCNEELESDIIDKSIDLLFKYYENILTQDQINTIILLKV